MPEKRAKDAKLTDENRAESAALKRLYNSTPHGLTQEAFGERYGIGNQGAVWQCLNGTGMPISLKAARGFAAGLGCKISAFSPRLAALDAAGWPFEMVPHPTYDGLTEAQKGYVQKAMADAIKEISKTTSDDWKPIQQSKPAERKRIRKPPGNKRRPQDGDS